MPKWMKFFVALLLLPVLGGAAVALWRVLLHSGNADQTWVPLLAGLACWMVIYILLPKPMWIYVFGHELTHALWTWLFGGRVKRFKTTSKGGHVVITKSNFLIALAPYFFPLYAVLVVMLFVAGNLIWDWQRFLTVFHLVLGAAYAFHVSLTFNILQNRQSDITGEGYLFSAVIILLGNILVLLIGIPLLAERVSVTSALRWWMDATLDIVRRITMCQ